MEDEDVFIQITGVDSAIVTGMSMGRTLPLLKLIMRGSWTNSDDNIELPPMVLSMAAAVALSQGLQQRLKAIGEWPEEPPQAH